MDRLLEGLLLAFSLTVLTFISCMSCTGQNSNLFQATKVSTVTQTPPLRKFHSSIALVSTLPGPKGYNKYVATAWAFDKDHLMTAGHFCEGVDARNHVGKNGKFILVTGSNNKGQDKMIGLASWVAYVSGRPLDMCILSIENHGLIPLEIAESTDIIETEDPITLIGAPNGRHPLRREGSVWFVEDNYIGVGVEGQGGSSGSPVIWKNKVIGMINWDIADLNEGMLALRSEKLLPFIKKYVK